MFSYTRTVVPPSCTELCVCGSFTAPDQTNLILARSSQVIIYRVVDPNHQQSPGQTQQLLKQPTELIVEREKPTHTAPENEEDAEFMQLFGEEKASPTFARSFPSQSANMQGEKMNQAIKSPHLHLVGEYAMWGTIEGLSLVRHDGQPTDTLVIVFARAKVAMVRFNPVANDLLTVPPLLSFEDASQEEMRPLNSPPPMLRTGISSGCLAMIHSVSHLAIIPYKRHNILEDMDHDKHFISKEVQKEADDCRRVNLYELKDNPICEITDFAFLEGSFDVNILILHQPNPSWTGRLNARSHTHELLALTLSHTQEISRVWWKVDKLPHDAFRLVTVPKPLEGVLVLCSNAIIYVNSSSFYGLALNDYATFSPENSEKYEKKPDVPAIFLDGCSQVWIDSNRLLVVLQSGEVFLFHLIIDVKSVKSINPVRVGRVPIANDICLVGMNHLFLSSRFGESSLVRWSEDKTESSGKDASSSLGKRLFGGLEDSGSSSKRAKDNAERSDDIFFGDDEYAQKLFEEPSGKDASTNNQMKNISLKIVFALPNIGPIKDITIGRPEMFKHDLDQAASMDFAVCSGFERSGAINIMHRSVRANLLHSFFVEGCIKLFSIGRKSKPSKQAARQETLSGTSKSSRGSARSTNTSRSDEMFDHLDEEERLRLFESTGEDDGSGSEGNYQNESFADDDDSETNDREYRSNSDSDDEQKDANDEDDEEDDDEDDGDDEQFDIFGEDLSAFDSKRRKAEKKSLAQRGDKRKLRKNKNADSFDKYIVVSLQNRTMVFSCEKDIHDVTKESEFFFKGPTLATSVFANGNRIVQVHQRGIRLIERGVARCEIAVRDPAYNHGNGEGVEIVSASLCEPFVLAQLTNKDVLLYKVRQNSCDIDLLSWFARKPQVKIAKLCRLGDIEDNTFWETYKTHPLDIVCYLYRVDGSFEMISMPDGKTVFESHDFLQCYQLVEDTLELPNASLNEEPVVDVKDIMLSCFEGSLPYLVVLMTSLEFYVYTATVRRDMKSSSRLPLFFHKRASDPYTFRYSQTANQIRDCVEMIFPFRDIADMSGFFIAGDSPVWVFIKDGEVRTHPMKARNTITSFSPFHNRVFSSSFLFSSKESGGICQLPPNESYIRPWLTTKIPVKMTVHKIAYMPSAKAYAYVVSHRTNEVQNESGQHVPQMYETTFELRVQSPFFWNETAEIFQFEEHERVQQMRVLNLKPGKHSARPFLVVATAICQGEEVATDGRILVFDIGSSHVDETRTRPWIKLLSEKEKKYKAAVTTVAEVNNYLVAAIGPRVMLYQLTDQYELTGRNFYDANLMITDIQVIRNFILVGDVMKSTTLLLWKENVKRFDRLAKDIYIHDICSTQFLVNDDQISFMASDTRGNVQIWTWRKEDGKDLLCRHDYHIGSTTNKFIRVLMSSSASSSASSRSNTHRDNRVKEFNIFGTTNGMIGIVHNLDESVYRRLETLQQVLTHVLTTRAGTNPKGYRMTNAIKRLKTTQMRTMIDGDLIWRFLELNVRTQTAIAHQIHSDRSTILRTLRDIEHKSSRF